MPSARTLAQCIEDAAKSDPTRGFRFIPEDGSPASGSEASFSYTAIERASARYGGALQALGLRKGDRVALILPTNEDFVLAFFGAIRAGIVPVPIYPPLGLGQLQGYLDNTRHIVAKCGARALVTSAQIKRLLGTVQASCPALEQVVAIEGIRESMEPLKAEKITLDDTAFLQFTSGSTSRPKGVALTHGNLAANIKCIMEDGLQIRPEDHGISWLPLYHDMGLIGFVLAPANAPACRAYFCPPLLFLEAARVSWLQAITRHKGTIAYAPNFAYALCRQAYPGQRPRRASTCLPGVSRAVEPSRFVRRRSRPSPELPSKRWGSGRQALLPSYGMAEVGTLAVAFTPARARHARRSPWTARSCGATGSCVEARGGRRPKILFGSYRVAPSFPGPRDRCHFRSQ